MLQRKLASFFYALVCIGSFAAPALGPRSASASPADDSAAFDQAHGQWSSLLKKYVVVRGPESRVNYRKLKSDRKELDDYLKSLERVRKASFDQFTDAQKIAFLINAYNAFTVALIVDHYPVSSIKKIGSFLTNPWKIKFFVLFGEKRGLDDIEHDMLRKRFAEPRIHFALVCASKGCPALRDEAFTGDRLDRQLEDSAAIFLKDESRNRYVSQAKRLEISSLFKWYGDDFRGKFGSVEAFIAPRITSNAVDQSAIRAKEASVSYLDYDWSLNDENQ